MTLGSSKRHTMKTHPRTVVSRRSAPPAKPASARKTPRTPKPTRSKAAARRPARSPQPVASPRWKRRPDERPAEILDAARDTFFERGFAATRLDAVARRAGVSKGTLYLYFESKETLFKAMIRETIVVVLERSEQHAESYAGSSRDLLEELLRGWWVAVHDSRLTGLPKLIFSEATQFPDLARFYFDEVVQRGRRLFAGVLRRGIERGEFRPIDVDYTVRIIQAPVVMALIWKGSMAKCQIDPLDFERHLDVLIDTILNGVVRKPVEPSPHA